MRPQRANERRSVYLMRVAAAFIRKHANYETMHYDETECDGNCLSDELNNQADLMDVQVEKPLDKDSNSA